MYNNAQRSIGRWGHTDARLFLRSLYWLSSAAPHHVQDRRSHAQGPSDVNTSIPEQPHKPRRTCFTRHLRSARAPLLSVPRTRTDIARRAILCRCAVCLEPASWQY